MQIKKRTAVVGVDLGCTGDDALMEGLRLVAADVVAKLHLLYVIDPKAPIEPACSRFENEANELLNAPKRVERRALSLCRIYGIDIDPTRLVADARIGEPATTLLQMCVDHEADLLIVGTHGRTGLDRVLDGSVAESVMRRARCPVIVARRKDYASSARTVRPDPPYQPGEAPRHVEVASGVVQPSTTLDSWTPSDNGPTGFRIV